VYLAPTYIHQLVFRLEYWWVMTTREHESLQSLEAPSNWRQKSWQSNEHGVDYKMVCFKQNLQHICGQISKFLNLLYQPSMSSEQKKSTNINIVQKNIPSTGRPQSIFSNKSRFLKQNDSSYEPICGSTVAQKWHIISRKSLTQENSVRFLSIIFILQLNLGILKSQGTKKKFQLPR